MIQMEVNGVQALIAATKKVGASFSRELSIAVGEATRHTVSQLAKQIQSTGILIAQRDIKKGISVIQKATATSPKAIVGLKKGKRLGLNVFKPKQTKAGVKYAITKGNTRTIPNAFVIEKWSRKVYIRRGEDRGPLRQMRGISPHAIFLKQGKLPNLVHDVDEYLRKQIQRRIRYLLLKAEGKI